MAGDVGRGFEGATEPENPRERDHSDRAIVEFSGGGKTRPFVVCNFQVVRSFNKELTLDQASLPEN